FYTVLPDPRHIQPPFDPNECDHLDELYTTEGRPRRSRRGAPLRCSRNREGREGPPTACWKYARAPAPLSAPESAGKAPPERRNPLARSRLRPGPDRATIGAASHRAQPATLAGP